MLKGQDIHLDRGATGGSCFLERVTKERLAASHCDVENQHRQHQVLPLLYLVFMTLTEAGIF